MGKRVFLFLLIAIAIVPYATATWYCPNGICQFDFVDSLCNRQTESTRACVGSVYFGQNSACRIGASSCEGAGAWQNCQNWYDLSLYQVTENRLYDGIDNDCDGIVDEGAIVENSCTDTSDNNGNGLVDCQDRGCANTFVQNDKKCITLTDVDINDNLAIEGNDLAVLAAALGSEPGDANWNANADINKDLIVDQKDQDWLGQSFGMTNIQNDFTCASVPSSFKYDFVAPLNVTGKANVSVDLDLASYKIEFTPVPLKKYVISDVSRNNKKCFVSQGVFRRSLNEEVTLYQVTIDISGFAVYVPVAYDITAVGCSGTDDPYNRSIVQANWSWTELSNGINDCSVKNCEDSCHVWQDQGTQCGYITERFGKDLGYSTIGPRAYVKVAAGQASSWNNLNNLYLGSEQLDVHCIEPAGSTICGGTSSNYDKIVINGVPNGDYHYGSLTGIVNTCTFGNSLSCNEALTGESELRSVAISPGNCASGSSGDCEPGESVSITASFSRVCAAVDNLQVDASGQPGNDCDILYSGATAEITQGINSNIASMSNPLTLSWNLPATIPSSCYGATITPLTGAIYRGGVPGTGTWIDNTQDSGDSVSGSFKIYVPSGVTTTSVTSTTSSSTTGTSTVLSGGGGSFCGNGVKEYGEDCDSNGLDQNCLDIMPVAGQQPYDSCDLYGIITGTRVGCRCYKSSSLGMEQTVIFSTNCQDDGDGDSIGTRVETTRVLSNGAVVSETSQKISCTLSPVKVPGFSFVNLILASLILIGYYTIKKKN